MEATPSRQTLFICDTDDGDNPLKIKKESRLHKALGVRLFFANNHFS